MTLHRQREQATAWVLTLAAMVSMVVAWLTGHPWWLAGIALGFFALMGMFTFAIRLAVPKEQRRSDPRPWHKALFKLDRPLERITASVPDLQLAQEKEGRRLWQVERRGPLGIWTAQVEECDGKVVAYSESYQGHYTMAFDFGIARVGQSSPFFPKGYRVKARVVSSKADS